LHGDRKSGDDGAVVGGLARLGEYKVAVIGYEGSGSAETFEAPGAKGYRKGTRLMRLAGAFGKPVIIFLDIPDSSSPSILEQQTGEAMARSLEEMSCLLVPIIGVIAGESNGTRTIDMCAMDRIIMLENASCCISSSSGFSTEDANSKRTYLKARDLLDMNVVDKVVEEPSGDDPKFVASILRETIMEELGELIQIHPETLVQQRLTRLQHIFLDFSAGPSGN
jgi:acetyl-CoA carboxylase carboxyl transferase subunit alpha